MKKALLLTPFLFVAAAACNNEPEIDYDKQELTIHATIAATKTSISSSSLEWESGDNITVALDGESYVFKTTEQGSSATFTPEDGLTQGQVAGSPLAAYYGCDFTGSFTIPQNQTIVGGVSRTGVPMYAYTMNAPEEASIDMTFKPVASAIEVKFLPFDLTVNKIELSPVDESSVNGSFAGGFTVNPVTGKVTAKNAIHSVAAVFSSGLNISKGASFIFPIGWFSLEGGIKISVTYNEDGLYEDVILADAPFQSYEGSGDARSYKFIHQDIELSVGPRDWYVKADGNANNKGRNWNEATTLDNAIANADAGSTIHIAPGEYAPGKFPRGYEGNVAENKTFEVSKALKIVGGEGASKPEDITVLNGGGVFHTMIVTTPDKVEIENLTITGGNAAGETDFTSEVNGEVYSAKNGGGFYAVAADVALKNVTIKSNSGNTAAGAYMVKTAAELENVTVLQNGATGNGGGMMLSECVATLKSCTIQGNTAVGISAGLYLYADADKKSEITLTDCVITKNSSTDNSVGGLDVRGGSATADIKAVLNGCTISENTAPATGKMSGGFRVINAKAEFNDCKILDNSATGNGANLIYEASDVVFNNCLFKGNSAGLGAAIYQYTSTAKSTVKVIGCQFTGNTTAGRGGAIYTRSGHASGSYLYVINSTIDGNKSGSTGSAIALYGAAATPAEAYVFNSTVIGNTCTRTSATPGGAIGLETAGMKAFVYNSIVSGNAWAAAPAAADIYSHASSTCTVCKSVVGTKAYDEAGKEVSGASFDPATMLSAVTDKSKLTGVFKLTGSANPALSNGMAVSDVKAVASAYFTDAVIAADQWGNARTGNVMGAYVAQ